MALYWPDQKVALDIIDDPARRPFEGDESYTVLRVTSADLADYESYRKVMCRLCALLGKEPPSEEDWQQVHGESFDAFMHWDFEEELLTSAWSTDRARYEDDVDDDQIESVEILASSLEAAELMRKNAERDGRHVRGTTIWEGPIPKGSYEDLGSGIRMSTPEFFFFRKVNQMPFFDAVSLGNELCGKYRTACTQHDHDDGYDFLSRTRTTKARLRSYLRGARGTKECKRAKRVLRHMVDECGSPMANYLFLLLCTAKVQGGYGLEHPLMSAAFESERTLVPSSNGPYIAYDLCWPNKRIAVQYTGACKPSKQAMASLNAEGMRTVCVTDKDLTSADAFDRVARKIANLLETPVPDADNKEWLGARKRLRKHVRAPQYEAMRLTIDDISEHYAA